MDLKFVRFQDVDGEIWDKWVAAINESTYLHSATFLNFLHEMIASEGEVLSFACLENKDTPLAICPLGISANSLQEIQFYEASWDGAPLGAPAFSSMRPSLMWKVKNQVYDHFHQLIKEHEGRRSLLRKHIISIGALEGTQISIAGQYDILRYGYECQPQNTLIIDLKNPAEELKLQLSRYQRKHLKQAEKQNLEVKVYDGTCLAEDVEKMFLLYQEAHNKSAGFTRPQETFDMMLSLLTRGLATLFVAFVNNVPISFLYCGEFHQFAFGWSQVNEDEYEREFSPRHYLEWQAIMSYKQKGFQFYEVGTVWFGPQLYKNPSSKELSIAEFKRRYGGVLLPELVFEKYFDKELWERVHQTRLTEFLAANKFDYETTN